MIIWCDDDKIKWWWRFGIIFKDNGRLWVLVMEGNGDGDGDDWNRFWGWVGGFGGVDDEDDDDDDVGGFMGYELCGDSVCFVVGGLNFVVIGGCGEEF